MLILFHALAGLCLGLFSGLQYGLLVGIALSLGGCAFGLIAGLMMVHMPRMLTAGTHRIAHNRFLASMLTLLGHLIWVGVCFSFWWVCLTYFTTDVSQ